MDELQKVLFEINQDTLATLSAFDPDKVYIVEVDVSSMHTEQAQNYMRTLGLTFQNAGIQVIITAMQNGKSILKFTQLEKYAIEYAKAVRDELPDPEVGTIKTETKAPIDVLRDFCRQNNITVPNDDIASYCKAINNVRAKAKLYCPQNVWNVIKMYKVNNSKELLNKGAQNGK